jgi:hypothetical protein
MTNSAAIAKMFESNVCMHNVSTDSNTCIANIQDLQCNSKPAAKEVACGCTCRCMTNPADIVLQSSRYNAICWSVYASAERIAERN